MRMKTETLDLQAPEKEDYRCLINGEIMLEGDEFLIGTWQPVPPSQIGQKYWWGLYPCRRKLI